MITERVSANMPYPSQYVDVLGSKMHYVEAGSGTPILLLHGVPTSCYVWRNVIPHLSTLGRCIAPDLIGFGQSDKPNIDYTVFDHINYIEHFIKALNLKKVILVTHDWGSVIGLDYAMKNENNCKAIVMYEALLRAPDIDEAPLPYLEQMITLRKQNTTEQIINDGAAIIDQMLPQHLMRKMNSEEMKHYREPFAEKNAGKPIAQYLTELTSMTDGDKLDKLISNYTDQLTRSQLPKLLLYSVPGFVTTMAAIMWAKANVPKLEITDIGEELHLAQESHPEIMGETISVWLQGIKV